MLKNQMNTVFSNQNKQTYAKKHTKILGGKEFVPVWVVIWQRGIVFWYLSKIFLLISVSHLFYEDWLLVNLKSLLCQLRLKSKEFQAFQRVLDELVISNHTQMQV